MEDIFKKMKILLIGGALLFVIFGILPVTAQAASLYFSPSSGTHAVGTSFTVSVYVSSADQAMNAASGVISFPSDKLSVESLSKSGSVFSLWVQEPSFSNSAGTINFEGIVLNPGFTGASGKAINITFKTKAAGSTRLGRDSISKRLGIKLYAGEIAKPGYILVRQRGTKFLPGENVRRGADDTLYAVASGKVLFKTKKKTCFDGKQKVAKVVSILSK